MTKESSSFCRTLTLEASPKNLREVRSFIEEIAKELGLGEEEAYDLKVAVSEATANAIEHSGGLTYLEICAHLHPDRLTVEISDGGDFRLAPRRPDSSSGRGLGLPLMVALMDEVRIYKTPEKGTTVALSLFVGVRNGTNNGA
ncbi:MAG: anti-sigma B factor RsbW [Thermoleophilia bacterium]